MTRALAVLAALLLVVSVASAAGNEIEGKVKSYDKATNTLTLEDGTQITVPASVKVDEKVKAGAMVKAAFEEKDGKKTATAIEVK
jgi:hypothetical protein